MFKRLTPIVEVTSDEWKWLLAFMIAGAMHVVIVHISSFGQRDVSDVLFMATLVGLGMGYFTTYPRKRQWKLRTAMYFLTYFVGGVITLLLFLGLQ